MDIQVKVKGVHYRLG